MRLTASSVLLLLALSTIVASARDHAPRVLSPDDLYSAASVSDAQVSPDGSWVAYLVGTSDRQADAAISAVWMVSWDGREHVALTRAGKGIRAPRWSADGRLLSFVASNAQSQRDELMVLDLRGGAPRAVSDAQDIGDYAWSPHGARIVAVMQGRADAAAKTPRPVVIDSLYFKQDEDGYLGAERRRSLYLIDVERADTQALAVADEGNDSAPAWSVDGRRIAFVRTRELGPDPDGMEDILAAEARPGAAAARIVRTFAPNRQKLAWSEDGALAYLTGQEPRFNQYIQDGLALIRSGGGAPRMLAAALDRGITSFALIPGSGSIAATVADDGSGYAIRVDERSGRVTRLAEGPHVISAISQGGGHTAVLFSDDHAPAEVYALEGSGLRPLTSHNAAWMSDVRLGTVEDSRVRSKDGTVVHAFFVKPPDYVPGRRYPTVVWLHGGPNGQDAHELKISGDQFMRQLLAARGYLAVGVNYRGSSGRGRSFQTAIAADWGRLEIDDIEAVLGRAVGSGLADPGRLGIGGWSYGAILTDYAIAADGRFKAAISGAGSANVTAMYGGDEYVVQYNHELGVPWGNTERWLRLSSPFLRAERIHTPTLFMGGDRDFDVPLIGGEQMYQALRTLGVPAQLVVYPGEYHTLRRPSFLVDRATRMGAWLERFL